MNKSRGRKSGRKSGPKSKKGGKRIPASRTSGGDSRSFKRTVSPFQEQFTETANAVEKYLRDIFAKQCSCGKLCTKMGKTILGPCFHDRNLGLYLGGPKGMAAKLFVEATGIGVSGLGDFFGSYRQRNCSPYSFNQCFNKKAISYQMKQSYATVVEDSCENCRNGLIRFFVVYQLIRTWLFEVNPEVALSQMMDLLRAFEYQSNHDSQLLTKEICRVLGRLFKFYKLGYLMKQQKTCSLELDVKRHSYNGRTFVSSETKLVRHDVEASRVPEWFVAIPRRTICFGGNGEKPMTASLSDFIVSKPSGEEKKEKAEAKAVAKAKAKAKAEVDVEADVDAEEAVTITDRVLERTLMYANTESLDDDSIGIDEGSRYNRFSHVKAGKRERKLLKKKMIDKPINNFALVSVLHSKDWDGSTHFIGVVVDGVLIGSIVEFQLSISKSEGSGSRSRSTKGGSGVQKCKAGSSKKTNRNHRKFQNLKVGQIIPVKFADGFKPEVLDREQKGDVPIHSLKFNKMLKELKNL